jgi:hypothetical protein
MFKNPARLKKMLSEGYSSAEVVRFFGITYPTLYKYNAMSLDMAEKLERELVGRFGDPFAELAFPEKKPFEGEQIPIVQSSCARAMRSLELMESRKEKAEEKVRALYEKRLAKQQKKAAALAKKRADQESKKAARLAYANELAAHYKAGKNMQQIGDFYGVTRERVRQVLVSIGINYSSSGRALSADQKRKSAAERRIEWKEQNILKRWGCSVEEHKEGKKLGYVLAFTEQRRNARNRGIEWRLSYKQWIDWWRATGRLDARGRTGGGYCMSRIGDSGPYSLENIECKTIAENSREALTRRPTKPSDQAGVFKILCGTSKPYLAKYGRVRLGFYETAEDAINARKEYMGRNGLSRRNELGGGKGYTVTKKGYVVMQFRDKKRHCKSIEEAKALYQTLANQYKQGMAA